jgi:cytochrome c biogenesis protein CcmG/thiol:disulfide interchange protein DsbE
VTRFAFPAAALVTLAAVLAATLGDGPREAPSPLLGRSTPVFSVPRLDDPARTLAHTDLQGAVSLLNVWATWCVPCRQEHETLLGIARDTGVPIYGLNYRDDRDDARRWLRLLGDPYRATGFDGDGSASLGLGVEGAPETYVIDASGRIAHKHVGPLTPQVWEHTLSPLIRRLRQRDTG